MCHSGNESHFSWYIYASPGINKLKPLMKSKTWFSHSRSLILNFTSIIPQGRPSLDALKWNRKPQKKQKTRTVNFGKKSGKSSVLGYETLTAYSLKYVLEKVFSPGHFLFDLFLTVGHYFKHFKQRIILTICYISHFRPPVSVTGLIPSLRPANERRRYKVTTSLIGWVQT